MKDTSDEGDLTSNHGKVLVGNLELFHIAESLWDCVHQDGSCAAMGGGGGAG